MPANAAGRLTSAGAAAAAAAAASQQVVHAATMKASCMAFNGLRQGFLDLWQVCYSRSPLRSEHKPKMGAALATERARCAELVYNSQLRGWQGPSALCA